MDIFMVEYLENFLTNMAVKEFWKSVHICQSYDKKSSVLFFETQCIYTFRHKHVWDTFSHLYAFTVSQPNCVLKHDAMHVYRATLERAAAMLEASIRMQLQICDEGSRYSSMTVPVIDTRNATICKHSRA